MTNRAGIVFRWSVFVGLILFLLSLVGLLCYEFQLDRKGQELSNLFKRTQVYYAEQSLSVYLSFDLAGDDDSEINWDSLGDFIPGLKSSLANQHPDFDHIEFSIDESTIDLSLEQLTLAGDRIPETISHYPAHLVLEKIFNRALSDHSSAAAVSYRGNKVYIGPEDWPPPTWSQRVYDLLTQWIYLN